jgi:hypothetical protein
MYLLWNNVIIYIGDNALLQGNRNYLLYYTLDGWIL